MVYGLRLSSKDNFFRLMCKKREMLANNPFFSLIHSNITLLENKITSNVSRWKIKPEDINWIKGSAKGIFGKMFEILFEYIVEIERISNMSEAEDKKMLIRFIDKYTNSYNNTVVEKQKTFKNIEDLKKETSTENLFKKFVVFVFEISYWYYYNINLDPSSKSSLKHSKTTIHQGIRDSVKKTFKNVKNGLEDLKVVRSIKIFFFNFFKSHEDSFTDLTNSIYTIKFNWNYRTWNEKMQETNPIHEFDISVFKTDENGELIELIHVYELKFSERKPLERIQDVKKNSTDGKIKMYLKFTKEKFEANLIDPKYTILVFTTGEVRTI